MKTIYICATNRTPLGGFQGSFSSLTATDLGAESIKGTLNKAGISTSSIDEVYFGNVISAGLGQAPARQAALKSGIDISTPCTTVSKVCGSGMKAIMLAADNIQCGHSELVIAGGMESMSNAPYLLNNARSGYRLGHNATKDSMFVDGLEDAESGRLMGEFGQQVADKYAISREQMDDYAIESLQRAINATDNDAFANEISPVTMRTRKGETVVEKDEQLASAKPEKIRTLKPAFAKDGSVTAANSSSISDGAASMIVCAEEALSKNSISPEAKLVAQASHAQAPAEFTLAPIGAIRKVLAQTGWNKNDVDLFEINEAFAVVALLAMNDLDLDHKKVNIHGGACALGHPLGASGARIIVTLIHALKRTGGKRGIASLCIGGGEATAVAIELI
ncbi:MAG: thiolase family protein [Gammaproteobacteria bacterium]|nr:thiolase family protein [Gammaproteobacteria bacterium]